MEPEGSLPHSQMPATCPYPEPAQFNTVPWQSEHLYIDMPSSLSQNTLYIAMPSSPTVRTPCILPSPVPSVRTTCILPCPVPRQSEHPVYCQAQFPHSQNTLYIAMPSSLTVRTPCILPCPVPRQSEHSVYCHVQCPDSDQLSEIFIVQFRNCLSCSWSGHVTCVTVTLTVKLAWLLTVQSVLCATELCAKLFQPKATGLVSRCAALHTKRNRYRPATDF
jgi:hypothetical protein